MGQVVQRHGDVEVLLQLADQFKYLERVEAEIAEQLVLDPRLDGTAADVLQDFDGFTFEPVG